MHRLHKKIEQWTGPPWPRKVRLLLILALVIFWACCYWFRWTSAGGFAVLGYSAAACVLVIKRILWKRSLSEQQRPIGRSGG
jgi:hypothetical protein